MSGKMMIHLNMVPVWEVAQGAQCPVHCHSDVHATTEIQRFP
jgi:hypothetical protein